MSQEPSKERRVIVVGGGFSGLAAAHFAIQKGFHVTVYEKSSRWGGLLGTRYETWGLVEKAANGILLTETVRDWANEIGLKLLKPSRSSRRRFIYRHRPTQWPLTFRESLGLFSSLVRWMRDRHRRAYPRSGETVSQWVLRYFSPSVLNYIVAPALGGIYASHPDQLSATLVVAPLMKGKGEFHRSPGTPRDKNHHSVALAGRKRERNWGTVAPSRGMGELVETWVEYLKKRGVQFELNCNYELPPEIEVPHILCTNAKMAGALLTNVAPQAAKTLQRVQMVPLVTATLAFKSTQRSIRGFGCLFPPAENFSSLGVLFNTSLFPGRTVEGIESETWILGGASHRFSWANLDDSEILELIKKDRQKAFRITEDPIHSCITRWPDALPIYSVEWEECLKEIELPKNIYLCGNYLGGIGLAKILSRARSLPWDQM